MEMAENDSFASTPTHGDPQPENHRVLKSGPKCLCQLPIAAVALCNRQPQTLRPISINI